MGGSTMGLHRHVSQERWLAALPQASGRRAGMRASAALGAPACAGKKEQTKYLQFPNRLMRVPGWEAGQAKWGRGLQRSAKWRETTQWERQCRSSQC